jgi:hemoglobin
MEKAKTIYEVLGDKNLQLLLDSFYNRVFSSPIIGKLFNQTDAETIKDKQFCFLSQFLGGPPRYQLKYGQPKMRQRHLPHAIDAEAKDEWLRLMKLSIDELSIPANYKDALYNCFPQVAQHMVNK